MTTRYTDLKPGIRGFGPDPFHREPDYFSLRWKLTMPLFAVLLTFAMVVTYIVTDAVTRGSQAAQTNQLLLSVQGVWGGMRALYERQLNETMRMAFLQGVAEAVAAGDADRLHAMLEPEALAANLDGLIVLDAAGVELLGLQRVTPGGRVDYAVSTGGDLSEQPLVQAMLGEGRPGAAGLLRTPEGYVLFTAWPLAQGDVLIGQVLAGTRLARALEMMRGSSLTQVALYDAQDAGLLWTTFEARGSLYDSLSLPPDQAQQALRDPATVPVRAVTVYGRPYQMAAVPFVVGQDTLGVLGVYLPSSLPYATDLSRQLLSLLMASLAAAVVIAAYGAAGWVLGHVGRITATAQALAGGDLGARTGMRNADELGSLGRSLDVYADRVQQRQDWLRTMLCRQRRENARLVAILEAMPDGIIVQDLDGRVLLMNGPARQLLGSQRAFRSSGLGQLTAVVTDVLGPALAPGVYALGEPQRIPLEGRVLSAQAAAILSVSGKRVGTVIVLRDISAQVQREQAREALLLDLARDVQEPLMELVAMRSPADADPPLQRFAYEVMRNAIRLQRIVTQLQDLADLAPQQLETGQHPLPVELLVNGLAVEWGATAQASELSLQVMILQRELYVLGDERRLRWALGNLVDNAVKYTPAGGKVSIIARRQSESMAELIIQDTGVGIHPEDLPHVFTRFYRGTPRLADGSVLHVPGMGQGLFIARRVIEAHGGTIRLESRPGRGTRVVCALPLTAPVAMALQQREEPLYQEAPLPMERDRARRR